MSRYIDADALIAKYGKKLMCNEITSEEYYAIKIPLDYIPTADVVEVVRCKDCKWYKSIFSWNGNEHKICVREPGEPPREPDDYCSYGEGREDAK